MKINYILSDTTKQATSAALKKVIEKAESDIFGSYVVIVPETKSIIIEKELLALSKNGAFANVYIYSFVRLVNRLGFVPAEKIVSKQSCVMLLRKIIFDNFNNLKCYQKTAKTVGFAEKIYDTIQQFKSSNITVDELKSKVIEATSALKAKLEDIVLLYEEYEKVLAGRFYDDCDKLNLIGNFAKNSNFIKNAEIFVVGFDNVTFEMTSVLKELAANSKEITFSCCYFHPKRTDKYIQKNELYDKFKHIADDFKIAYDPENFASNKKDDFFMIQNRLFATDRRKTKSKGQVSVFEATSKKQEIDYIANQILIEIENGKRFKDIGVFACGLEKDTKLIEDCFKAYEIPYFINKEHDIKNHVLTNFIASCFELKKSHLSREKVLKFLSSPFFGVKNYAFFENYANAVGLNYNSFLENLDKESFANDIEFEKVNAVLVKFQKFYELFEQVLNGAKTVNDYLKAIEFVFEYFEIQKKLEEIAVFEKENGLEIQAEITLAIYEKCLEFVKTFSNFMGDMNVEIEEFLQVFLSGFGTIKLNLVPVSIDCVVVQPDTDGFFDIKTMFVLGAEDGKFPCKLQDSGIILDSELQETKELIKKPVEPSVKEINERELFRVYEAFLEPKERLYVSYALANSDGSRNKPSRMVLRLIDLFGEEIKSTSADGYNKPIAPVKSGYEMKFVKNVNKFLNGLFDAEPLNKQFSILEKDMTSGLKDYLLSISYGEKEFQINGVQDLYFTKKTTSISQLEKYFSCPYLFFATYGLRLKENKNAKLSSVDIGSIVHRIAELFVNDIATYDNLVEDDFDKKVDALCDVVYAEYKVNLKQNKALLFFVSNESKRLCRHLLYEQKSSSFKNKKELNEYSFSGENSVKLQIDDKTVIAIEGKIDRIDEWGDYIRIIDYKTGDIKSDMGSIYYGKKIQLVSYLSAADKIKNKKVAGLFYFPIHSDYVKKDKNIEEIYKLQGFLIDDADVLKHMDNNVNFENPESHLIQFAIKQNKKVIETNTFEISKGTRRCYLSNEQFEDMKSYNEKLCTGAIQEILSGYAEPSPLVQSGDDEGACKWCALSGFCGLEKARLKHGRKCNDAVTVNSFKEIEEGGDADE